jgi:hypothetical protein
MVTFILPGAGDLMVVVRNIDHERRTAALPSGSGEHAGATDVS